MFNLNPSRNTRYSLRISDNIPSFNIKHNFFKNYFFPLTIIERNNLDVCLGKYGSFNVFKKGIQKFIRPFSNSSYNYHNLTAIKFIKRICFGLRCLWEHKCNHSFQESINPICNCSSDVEFAIHFFLHCLLYSNEHCTLLSSLS